MHDENRVGTGSEGSVSGPVSDDGYPVNPDWLRLSSVGVDIGSSTSHLMFSKLVLQRQSAGLSSQFAVVDRIVRYRSSVLVTPYTDAGTIDVDSLSRFIDYGYAEAGISPEGVDTGAVICTGEAVRKRNSEAIVRMLSERGGRFVAATAGPNLEAVLGAHGSGAVARSREGGIVMNVDIGGGTSKISISRDGTVRGTAVINVGARLIAWNECSRIVRIEEAAQKAAEAVGICLQLGDLLENEQKERLAGALADVLIESLGKGSVSSLAESLMVTAPATFEEPIDELSFSGGVAEYIYGLHSSSYGDMGPLLGAAIRERVPQLDVPVAPSDERIRATVIGASQYTVQLSSSTVFISRDDLLPIADLQVVPVSLTDGASNLTRGTVAEAVREALRRMDIEPGGFNRPFALAVSGAIVPSYRVIRALAEGVAESLDFCRDGPWVLVLSSDIAGLVGPMLKEELTVTPEVVAVDGIRVGTLDYIDVGEKIDSAQAIPVVVKSLIFE